MQTAIIFLNTPVNFSISLEWNRNFSARNEISIILDDMFQFLFQLLAFRKVPFNAKKKKNDKFHYSSTFDDAFEFYEFSSIIWHCFIS